MPQHAVRAARAALPAGYALAAIAAEQAEGHVVVRATVAGAAPPSSQLAETLLAALQPLLAQTLRVDLDYTFRASAGIGVAPGR